MSTTGFQASNRETTRVCGVRLTLPTSALETVWDGSGELTLPAAAGAASVVSSDPGDGPGGGGALTVTIEGIDSNGKAAREDAVLDGLTPVPLTKTYLRILSCVVLTAGTGGKNIGNIDVSIGSDVQQRVLPAKNVARSSLYSVPSDRGLYVNDLEVVWGGTDPVHVQLVERTSDIERVRFEGSFSRSARVDLLGAGPYGPGADVLVRAQLLGTASSLPFAVAYGAGLE